MTAMGMMTMRAMMPPLRVRLFFFRFGVTGGGVSYGGPGGGGGAVVTVVVDDDVLVVVVVADDNVVDVTEDVEDVAVDEEPVVDEDVDEVDVIDVVDVVRH